jgi:hypothetical protein
LREGVPLAESQRVDLTYQAPRDQWERFEGLKLDSRSFDRVIDYDADVYTPEGDLLLKFRKNCIPFEQMSVAYAILRKIRTKSLNRGMATNKLYANVQPIRKSGVVSKTREVPAKYAVNSNIIGYFDRYVRIPYCRQTAWTAKHPLEWERLHPFFLACNDVYAGAAPDRYAAHLRHAERVKPEWKIRGTVFTTVTVNRNWQTAVHTDAGDLKDGLSLITAMWLGKHQGGQLVFPHYRVAVDLQNCDLLMFDSHHMHGNAPIIGKTGGWERVSLVLYSREKMDRCLTASQELERAQNRKAGDPLYDDEGGNAD